MYTLNLLHHVEGADKVIEWLFENGKPYRVTWDDPDLTHAVTSVRKSAGTCAHDCVVRLIVSHGAPHWRRVSVGSYLLRPEAEAHADLFPDVRRIESYSPCGNRAPVATPVERHTGFVWPFEDLEFPVKDRRTLQMYNDHGIVFMDRPGPDDDAA